MASQNICDVTPPEHHFDSFFNQYLTTAVWADVEDDMNKDQSDFSAWAEEVLKAHALSYFSQVWPFLLAEDLSKFENLEDAFERLGHDFWLDQNGHGAGAKGGRFPKYGKKFYEVARKYPELDLYVSDCDGLIEIA